MEPKNKGIIDNLLFNLNVSSDIKEIMEGALYAGKAFKKYYDLMIAANNKFQLALEIKDIGLIKKWDEEFHKTVPYAEYYDYETDRLFKILSDRTGMPFFLTGTDGHMFLYEPDEPENKKTHLRVIK